MEVGPKHESTRASDVKEEEETNKQIQQKATNVNYVQINRLISQNKPAKYQNSGLYTYFQFCIR